MARGPCLHLQQVHKELGHILTEQVEPASKKACDCVVMTWYKGEPYTGKAQSFMCHVPPWATGTRGQQEQHAIDIVNAAWLDVGGRNAGVMNLPVIKVDPRSEESPYGNYWRC